MADFNFGKIGALIEATKSSNSNIDVGPTGGNLNGFYGPDSLSFVSNSDFALSVMGNSSDFIWGDMWGDPVARVGK